ncbi:MAG: GIY-YIG nuclease family protein [Chitinophagales bacterium]
MQNHNYFIYILTNPKKTVLYIGVTHDLERRLNEHFENRGRVKTFAGKYYCYNLIYFESYDNIESAIEREKELKKWSRKKKEALINKDNPNWNVLNKSVWEY